MMIKDRTFFACILTIREYGNDLKITGVTPTHCVEDVIEDYYFSGSKYLFVIVKKEGNRRYTKRFELKDWDVLNILGENIYDRGYSYAD